MDKFSETDPIKTLFAENPGVVIQVKEIEKVREVLDQHGLAYVEIAELTGDQVLTLKGLDLSLHIPTYRDIWFKSSYLLDQKQSGEKLATERFNNYKIQPLSYRFSENWAGKYSAFSLDPFRETPSGIKAAIIREKGVNGDREMAYGLWLAGFDVKDIHMTDLVSGRENLEDVNMVVFVGGFSNSDVLGSAKGWAGAFLYNEKARRSLENFYAREDTLSLGVCNGCQLMVELGLITPTHDEKPNMRYNDSHKFESAFVNVEIPENQTVMLGSLAGQRLGVWVAHGEGKFDFPKSKENYHIGMSYSYAAYPGNPNGSTHAVAGIASDDGRHLAIMPHMERSLAPWNWPYYIEGRENDEITPWVEALVNARTWVEKITSQI